MLENQNEVTNLEIIENKIQEEEFELLKKLFQNKTIIFENIFGKEDHKKLIIVKDEYLNWKPMENFLDSNLIRQIRMYEKMHSEIQQDILEISIDMIEMNRLFLDYNENTYTYNCLVLKVQALYQTHDYGQQDNNNDLNLLRESKKNRNSFQYLSMYNNELTKIKENTFINLNNLQELNLSNNQLKEIKETTFKGLNNLQTLSLGHNRLTEIKENTFINFI